MISVDEALAHLFALASPLPPETVPLRQAAGRVLAHPVTAQRTQPPFAASAMDGFAVKAAEVEQDALFKVVGEAAAGHGFAGSVGPGQAVRIFTGAPVPEGADFVVIQEDTSLRGDLMTVTAREFSSDNIRPAGADFSVGERFDKPTPLTPQDVALLAAMNHAEVTVRPAPVVAILPTGDELVQPGETPGPDQIIASNSYGLAALLEANGARARLLPAARDTAASLKTCLALAGDADLVVTIGGASVGDHDLVAGVTEDMGMERAFYKIAMRPGKPLMAGRIDGKPLIGLPGNPVSAMVCGSIFMLPVIRAMQGDAPTAAPRITARLSHDIGPNGPREHYMRAEVSDGQARIFDRQDSALLSVLSRANALAVRPVHDPARAAGELLDFIPL
ncbi:molybdopterin molybdotransferase MoeA [Aliishimia ponticola]|uniref:Molybdopterin molybdenumtransferase n=1 Tax=Aliishimia ponticola TaxID=2499833 RepID=A0A4S4NGR4_9RHOB|nr:gephyrin-like molybdotransferase Glp [Aliishimia ponticola]THH38854.1 molybdopterin molybdotransferase MoeA [Aliishimia ponticola]